MAPEDTVTWQNIAVSSVVKSLFWTSVWPEGELVQHSCSHTTWNAAWAFSQAFSRPAKSHSNGKSLTSLIFFFFFLFS